MPGELVLSPESAHFDAAHLDVPTPNSLVQDNESKDVDAARQRFVKKNRFVSLSSLSRRRSKKKRAEEEDRETSRSEEFSALVVEDLSLEQRVEVAPIHLGATTPEISTYDDTRDHYEWAFIYENQRGAMLFSTPYYSSLSLLPIDPSPFTLPNASKRRSEQPPITLDAYPLPDGNWKWVSRCWMIDMRSNLGEVQHDGFEYNWMFRKHHWRSQVGPLSAGGWVRRRRWIRLMVRPAKPRREHDETSSSTTRTNSPGPGSSKASSSDRQKYRRSLASLHPSSVLSGTTDSSALADHWYDMNPDDVWLGDSVEADWERLHEFMKKFGRDGKKLEVWRLWLGYYHPEHKDRFTEIDVKGNRREKQWTEDDGPLQSEMACLEIFSKETVALAPRQHVVPVLRKYGQKLLRSFIYPDSRVQFLKLLALSGLLQEMDIPMNNTVDVMSEIDFWSYVNNFTKELEVPDTPPTLKASVEQELEKRRSLKVPTKNCNTSPTVS